LYSDDSIWIAYLELKYTTIELANMLGWSVPQLILYSIPPIIMGLIIGSYITNKIKEKNNKRNL